MNLDEKINEIINAAVYFLNFDSHNIDSDKDLEKEISDIKIRINKLSVTLKKMEDYKSKMLSEIEKLENYIFMKRSEMFTKLGNMNNE